MESASETIKNEAKEQKRGFLGFIGMSLGTFSAIGNLLTGKGTIRAPEGHLELVKLVSEQVWIFNAASSFNKCLNTKVLSK